MTYYDYDVIVIGGGTAGLGAYRTAKSLRKKALIIEKNDFVTTCASVGCMPSKLLIAAAENMHEINKSSQFGINVENVTIDSKKLLGRVRSERDRFVGFVKAGAEKIDINDRIIGEAKFIDKNTIEVNGKRYSANAFVIATGSRVFYPPLFEGLENDVLTNESVFEIEDIPQSMAVFGAGVIGLELGFAFHNLGTKISLFNRHSRLLRLSEDINNYLVKHIEDSFPFYYKEEVTKIKKVENNGKVQFDIYYGSEIKTVDKILIAVGRKPNIDNIGIHNHSIIREKYNAETTQLGKENLFLAGDVNDDLSLLHVAANEGVVAGKNAANYPNVKLRDYKNVNLTVVFASPQIMQIGFIPRDLAGIVKGQASFDDQGRSRVMLKNKGMLNVYFNARTHCFLGAEMIGPSAEHIAHLLAWQIEKNTILEELLEMPFYHPTIEEGVRTAFRDAGSKVTLHNKYKPLN